MILLTEVGSVSDHMLLKIVGEDYRECCYKIIDDLHYWSLVEFLDRVVNIFNLMQVLLIISIARDTNYCLDFQKDWNNALKNIYQPQRPHLLKQQICLITYMESK